MFGSNTNGIFSLLPHFQFGCRPQVWHWKPLQLIESPQDKPLSLRCSQRTSSLSKWFRITSCIKEYSSKRRFTLTSLRSTISISINDETMTWTLFIGPLSKGVNFCWVWNHRFSSYQSERSRIHKSKVSKNKLFFHIFWLFCEISLWYSTQTLATCCKEYAHEFPYNAADS